MKSLEIPHITMDEIDRSRGEWVGSGSFGRVFSGTWRNRPVVYKLLKHTFHASVISREAKVLHHLQGYPTIVNCLGIIEESGVVGLVMDHAMGIPLAACIEYYDMPSEAQSRVTDALIRTFVFLHECTVLYRDLKPENIMVDTRRWEMRLIDFGSAVILPTPRATVVGVVGTHGYMAPEVAEGRAYGLAADVYSLGMTLLRLWLGIGPCRSSKISHYLRDHGRCMPMRVRHIVYHSTRAAIDRPSMAELQRWIEATDPRVQQAWHTSVWRTMRSLMKGCWG